MAVTDPTENRVRLYFNSNGNFDRRNSVATGGVHPICVKIADFNGDGSGAFENPILYGVGFFRWR